MTILTPFQLLEINIISAQDLEPASKKMKTYASAWVNPKRRLKTMVDPEGNNNPTWNDKFVFRVDEDFLRRDTSAVMIELHAVHWLRDILVGTVRVLVGNLVPPPTRPQQRHHHHVGMRFVALQVRRPSGRPQGILNIGVAVLDSSMRSMPLYTQPSASAVGYRDLMAEEDPPHHHHNPKPVLIHRSRSERSEHPASFDTFSATNSSMIRTSIIGIVPKKGTTDILFNGKGKKGKASSVISGAELQDRPKEKGKKGKASSMLSYSVATTGMDSGDPIVDGSKVKVKDKNNEKPSLEMVEVGDDKSITKNNGLGIGLKKPVLKPGLESVAPKLPSGNGKFKFGAHKTNSIWSDSEVGPSPSEVAAALAVQKYPLEDDRSSVLEGWSLDKSVEGLKSKLERWRTELPPLYDRGYSSSSIRSTVHHPRRHSDGGGSGLFSCFGNVYGYECQCICGKPTGQKNLTRFRSPSIGSAGRSFI